MIWKQYTPLHVREACYGEWFEHFVLFPVKTEQDEWIWLKFVFARNVYFPNWFHDITPISCQYSLIKKSRHEI